MRHLLIAVTIGALATPALAAPPPEKKPPTGNAMFWTGAGLLVTGCLTVIAGGVTYGLSDGDGKRGAAGAGMMIGALPLSLAGLIVIIGGKNRREDFHRWQWKQQQRRLGASLGASPSGWMLGVRGAF